MILEEEQDALEQSKKELQRAEHLLFVSLKYTRTVDVIKSLILRLINSMNFANNALLKKAVDEEKIPNVPELPRVKVDFLRKLYPEEDLLKNFMEFYLLLRKLDKADFGREREFRRHVTMIASIDEKKIEVTIDIMQDYFEKTKEYLIYVKKLIYGEPQQQ